MIELPIDGIDDYSGWDIRKALFLLNKSNPVFLEWLNSPIVYKKDKIRYEMLIEASKKYFSPLSSIYHYMHMAKGNNREYLQGEIVKSKKYFYVLRPILACMWIKKYDETPPIEFETLLTLIDDPILISDINELLKRKKSGIELKNENAIPSIKAFINRMITEFDNYIDNFDGKNKPPSEYLDNLLWEIVKEL